MRERSRSCFNYVNLYNTADLLLAASTGTGSNVHVRRHMDALISLPRIDRRTVHQTQPVYCQCHQPLLHLSAAAQGAASTLDANMRPTHADHRDCIHSVYKAGRRTKQAVTGAVLARGSLLTPDCRRGCDCPTVHVLCLCFLTYTSLDSTSGAMNASSHGVLLSRAQRSHVSRL